MELPTPVGGSVFSGGMPPLVWAIVAVAFSLVLAVQDVQIPPPPRGFAPTQADMVVDAANVLSPQTVERINRIIFDVKARSGGEIAVVTLPDIAGRDVGDVALRIGREWKLGAGTAIGDSSRNAGVVILVVPKESSADGRGYISIQTGQGAEGFITDAMAGDIRREAIPYLQRQDYSSALELMALRVAQRYESEFGFTLDTALVPRGLERVGGGTPTGIRPQSLLFGFIILLFILSSIANASRRGRRGRRGRGGGDGCLTALLVADAMSHSGRRGGWGGGGFGGGFGGGGGGGFGGFGGGGGFSGGGSSGSW